MITITIKVRGVKRIRGKGDVYDIS